MTGIIEHVDGIARHGNSRRTVFHRKQAEAGGVGGDRPAGFRLPPMVDDRDIEDLLGPFDGFGVGAFAGEKERTQA
ncbi:hypothetical protein D3C72_2164990 [compost metagenome]